MKDGWLVEYEKLHTCDYTEANCKTPATCKLCGVAKDDILSDTHSYVGGSCSICGVADPDYSGPVATSESLTMKATTGTLASDSLSISWTAANFTFTTNKASSTTAIRTDDSDHFRAYQGTETTISGSQITKIVITVTESKYATALAGCTFTDGVTATIDGNNVILTVTSGTLDSITITATAQWRLKNIEVFYLPAAE